MARGIHNVSTVACHVSSAIQIFCQTLTPLRDAVIQLSQQQQEQHRSFRSCVVKDQSSLSILLELGKLLEALTTDNDETRTEAADPTQFFNLFEHECNANDLGDATQAFSALLRTIRTVFGEQRYPFEEHLRKIYEALFIGSLEQVIVGEKIIMASESKKDKDEHCRQLVEKRITRCKRRNRPLPCPLPLDGAHDSLQEAVEAFLQPTVVQGYNWDTTQEYEESITEAAISAKEMNEQDGAYETITDAWITKKQALFQSLPMYLLLHLQRFVYRNGQLEPTDNSIQIPLQLDLECKNNDDETIHHYVLLGAILHLEEKDDDEVESEGGHYVAVFRNNRPSGDTTTWTFVNDEKVSELSEDELQEILKGKGDNPMRATLLVYTDEESHTSRGPSLESLANEYRESLLSLTETPQESSPWDLVGKRLKIRWAKGNFYAGKVTSYNDSTGKHRVEYDDGDIKEYKLHKKVIQWEN